MAQFQTIKDEESVAHAHGTLENQYDYCLVETFQMDRLYQYIIIPHIGYFLARILYVPDNRDKPRYI